MSDVQSTTHSLIPLYYDGHQIRMAIDEHGVPWWVAQDITDRLGIVNLHTSVAKFPDDEKGKRRAYTLGGEQTVLMVNEPGLYRLIFQSRKKEAERFKRWVFHDVIPTLRRTGQYTMPGTPSVQPSNHLPPPPRYPMQERAHVTEYLLAVWTTLRQAQEPITNAEIARKNDMKEPVTRKWTRYLLHLGLLDMHETHPRHLFMIAEQADKRHAGYFQRLERLAAIMEKRQQRLYR
jgi:prophage antirepressor-like protein